MKKIELISSIRIEDNILSVKFMDSHTEDRTLSNFTEALKYFRDNYVPVYNITQIFKTDQRAYFIFFGAKYTKEAVS